MWGAPDAPRVAVAAHTTEGTCCACVFRAHEYTGATKCGQHLFHSQKSTHTHAHTLPAQGKHISAAHGRLRKRMWRSTCACLRVRCCTLMWALITHSRHVPIGSPNKNQNREYVYLYKYTHTHTEITVNTLRDARRKTCTRASRLKRHTCVLRRA